MSIAKRLKKHREAKASGHGPASPVSEPGGRNGRGLNLVMMDRLHSMIIDRNAAPFEYMSSCGLLKTKKDPVGFEQTRFSAGLRVRSLMEGAEPRSLKTVDLDGMPSGQGGIKHIGDYTLDCIKELTRVRRELDDGLSRTIWKESTRYATLEKLIYRDDWSVIDLPGNKRKAAVNQIHHGLDCLALMWGYITPAEFEKRWG